MHYRFNNGELFLGYVEFFSSAHMLKIQNFCELIAKCRYIS